jgi:hypothetical protein
MGYGKAGVMYIGMSMNKMSTVTKIVDFGSEHIVKSLALYI